MSSLDVVQSQKLELLCSLIGWCIASDVTLIVVAVITLIFEIRTVGDGMNATVEVTLMETAEAVALVEFADGVGDVIQLGNDSVLNFAQADNQPDDEQRGDKDEFCTDDEASFIAQELLHHLDIPSGDLET